MEILNFATGPVVQDPVEPYDNQLGGYHRCILEAPYRFDHVSESLCQLVGYSASELYNMSREQMPPPPMAQHSLIYDEDQDRMLLFLDDMASKEQTKSIRVRMVRKDGSILFVNEIMTSRRLQDGKMYGDAVIAELTEGQKRSIAEGVLSSVVPYGYLRCTFEEYPTITTINRQMLDYLGFSQDDANYTEVLKQNIFFMIPFEERELFKTYLHKAETTGKPVSVEHQFFKMDGTRVTLIGWLNVVQKPNKQREYAFIYMLTEFMRAPGQPLEDSSYFYALARAYDVVFKADLARRTFTCIHGREYLGSIYDSQMTLDGAKNFWVNNFIAQEDRDMMTEFLQKLFTAPAAIDSTHPLQAQFHVNWVDSQKFDYMAVAVQLDAFHVLLCCRNLSERKKRLEEPLPDFEEAPTSKQIFARTFGHFDLFLDGTPIVFSSAKEKELLALLIDRNGGTLNTNQAIGYLWEDETVDDKLLARYRKLAMGLKKTLTKYGISHIVINHAGVRSIDVNAIQCDYYELLKGNEQFTKSFHNVYMADYSWGEETLASLWDYS
jgi:PAS domain S-box-containing protein